LEDVGHLMAVTDYELEFENVFISKKNIIILLKSMNFSFEMYLL